MSTPQPAQPAKLIIGIFLREKGLFPEVAGRMEDCFGLLDVVSAWMPFDYTPYYREEMGAPLFRRMTAFKRLIAQERLPDIKLATNGLEAQYSANGRRQVNIDPGYVLRERVVLATGKNFSHRIYLRDGIYADLTLVYRQGDFRRLPWTYPDYADRTLRRFLCSVRDRYAFELRQTTPGGRQPPRDAAAGAARDL
jgi:hypothetical protein